MQTDSAHSTHASGDTNGKGATLEIDAALAKALSILDARHARFATKYPDDTTLDNFYPLRVAQGGFPAGSNLGWTTGFVPGVYWLAWELSREQRFRAAAETLVPSFIRRIDRQIDIDTHDLGFLYSLSCVAAWQLTGDTESKRAALAAAEYLITRFLEPAGILQAWGNLNDPNQRGRTIIDSLMNTPLLYWASAQTGDMRYATVARRHSEQLRDNIFRADDSTFHTFYWDMTTGAPSHGVTAQGFADESCWARGQAWGIYGFALNYRYTHDASYLNAAVRCAEYYLAHQPTDSVPFWDLSFTDGSSEERDSSAAAIAICGLLETARWVEDGERSVRYRQAAEVMLRSLISDYMPASQHESDALLLHGVYSKPEGKGVNEGNLWGDYFLVEAIMRMRNPDWQHYW